jgi:hypothetical protein
VQRLGQKKFFRPVSLGHLNLGAGHYVNLPIGWSM